MGIRKPRPDYNPDIPEFAVCPGCALRHGRVVNSDCLICEGSGTITLGRPALMYDTPAAVALGIAGALTASADAVLSGTVYANVHQQALPRTLDKLTALGLLERGEPCTRETTKVSMMLRGFTSHSRSSPRRHARWTPTLGQLPLWSS